MTWQEAFLRCGTAGGVSSSITKLVQGQGMMQMAQNCCAGENSYEVAMQEGKGLLLLSSIFNHWICLVNSVKVPFFKKMYISSLEPESP